MQSKIFEVPECKVICTFTGLEQSLDWFLLYAVVKDNVKHGFYFYFTYIFVNAQSQMAPRSWNHP